MERILSPGYFRGVLISLIRRIRSSSPHPQLSVIHPTEISNLVMDLYKAASMRGLHRTLEAIYPVRLLEVTAGKAVLNRGEGAINVGDVFEVYSLGKAYVDPDTGEMLGRGESKVAVINVSRVAPKFSEAEIVEGADALKGDLKGYLCRETSASIESKTKVEQKPIAW
jgi:CRISPR/Cas system-associated protein Cas5 (RAMP superfamily)